MSLIIADSGSSKTDWCLIDPEGKEQRFTTTGLNPFIRTAAECFQILEEELALEQREKVAEVIFYGAGIKNEEKANFVNDILKSYFTNASVHSYSDLLGAARALCENNEGLVAILGTGSNSCFYDGNGLRSHHPSLGYILGDEGSGTHMGKKVLQYYFYQTLDPELMIAFEQKYGNNLVAILDKIYKGPAANKYLASFAAFLAEHRGHYMVENIIEDALVAFHENHLLKYREAWNYPIHFIGSIAYTFQDKIKELHFEYGLTTGKIIKSPMENLIHYHKAFVV